MRKIKLAQSSQRGIIFCSNILPTIGVQVYYDKNDEKNISKRFCGIYPPEVSKDEKPLNKKAIILSIILIAAFGGITKNVSIIHGAVYFSLFGAKAFLELLINMYSSRIPDENGMTIAKTHAAEHKVINAYNRLRRVPTLEEIRNETYISKHCGNIETIRKAMNALIVFAVNILCGILSMDQLDLVVELPILLIVGAVAIFFVSEEVKHNYYRYLEIVYLTKPTDKELLLALRGVEEFEKMENMLKLDSQQFFQKLSKITDEGKNT